MAINKIWNAPKPMEYGESTAQWEWNRIPDRIKYWNGMVDFAGKRILDLGCGWGGETVALSEVANLAIGVDVAFGSLQTAQNFVRRKGRQSNAYFIQGSASTLPFANCSFDLVYANDIFEHLAQPKLALQEGFRVLRPGGMLVVQFAPLFYSPFGYHIQWALTIPWIHPIVPLRIIVEIRNAHRQPPIKANSWLDLGLNKMTSRYFKSLIRDVGFEVKIYRELGIKNLWFLLKIPIIRNIFLFGVHAVSIKPVAGMRV